MTDKEKILQAEICNECVAKGFLCMGLFDNLKCEYNQKMLNIIKKIVKEYGNELITFINSHYDSGRFEVLKKAYQLEKELGIDFFKKY